MTNLLTLSPADFCAATKACAEGREFALRHQTMADVWDACPNPLWLLFICRKVARVPDDRTLRLFAVWCARRTPLGDGRVTGDLITDPRLLAALDVAERYAEKRATDEELFAASDAADAAYADAFALAASAAAYADAYDAADAAAEAAALAAYDADAALAAQADQFRRVVANPFRT